MSTKSRIAVAACFAIASAAVFADSGDLSINDWSKVDNGGISVSTSRGVIEAELAEARRLGLLAVGEGPYPVGTDEQEQLVQQAGRRAAEQFAMSSESEG